MFYQRKTKQIEMHLPFHLPKSYPQILAVAEHLGRSGPLSAFSRPPSFLPGCQDFLKMTD